VARSIDVTGVGNALVDALVRIEDDSVLDRLGVVRGRMKPCDHAEWERAYEAVRGDHHVEIQSGGSCANALATLGFLGATTRFCGQVGDDQMGALYRQRIEEACGEHAIRVTGEHATGKCLAVISGPDAERTMFTDLGAATLLPSLGDFDAVIRASKVLHLEGYLFLGEPMRSRAFEAMAIAETHGVEVSVDLSDPFVVATVRDLMWSVCAEHADIVFLNAEEAELLCGGTAEKALAALAEVCDTVALKLGAQGSIVSQGDRSWAIDPQRVRAVDTTGAGDGYAGAYLYGRLRGWDPGDAGRLASRVAAATVSQMGAVVRDRAHLADMVREVAP
jgi:sugar/nucleoside kinase (ribokinase family)